MNRTLFFLAGKLCLLVASTAIGMGGYLLLGGKEPGEEAIPSLSGLPGVGSIDQGWDLPAKPTLLARTVSPVDVGGDALGVLYILQRNGEIVRVGNEGGSLSVSTRFASLATEATESSIGFSAIAFHPGFLVKESLGYGKFYVVVAEKARTENPDFIPEFGYTSEHHQDVLYEYTTRFPLAGNFSGTRREVMRFSQPGPDNNLRSLTFDLYGHLYLAVGDGAIAEIGRRSPSRNASSLTSAYGKVLRIDPTGRNSINGRYGIPETNPFKLVTEALPELWVFGLRAPHSLYFDPFRGALCIGESSYDGIEKVNVSEYGGEHFGWDLSEGSYFFNRAARDELDSIMTSPALQVNRSGGQIGHSTGNVVYRGENFPSLADKLIFASHDGQLIVADSETGNQGTSPKLLDLGDLHRKSFSALRTTPQGELIVLCEDGSVYEMRKGVSHGEEKDPERTLYCQVDGRSFSSSKLR